MLSKKRVIIGISVIAVVAAWLYCVIDINTRFPAPEYLEYSRSNPCVYNDLEITPLYSEIHTLQSIKDTYSYDPTSPGMQDNGNNRYVVYSVKVKNIGNKTLQFQPIRMEAFDSKTCWANGINPMDESKVSFTIMPGEEYTVMLVGLIGHNWLSDEQRAQLDAKTFRLVMSYYPQNIVLRFDE